MMKLYRLYLSFTLKNALRFPRRAFKILPGLALTFAGMAFLLFMIITTSPKPADVYDTIAVLVTPFLILLIMLGLTLTNIYTNTGIAGARAADASLLMPAPLTPFQFYTFINLKQLSSIVGFAFLSSIYSGATLAYLPHPSVIIAIYFAILLLLYILGDIHYVARTTTHPFGQYLKHILAGLFIGFIALLVFIAMSQGIPALLVNPYLLYYPLIGWCFGLMVGLATWQLSNIIIFTALLIISYLTTHALAKRSTYNYYEEELTSVHKIEAAYQRAYSHKGIELKAKFVKTNRNMTHTNEKVLLDMAWIRAGKKWYLKFSSLIKLAILGVVTYVTLISVDNMHSFALVTGVAIGYIRFFGVRTHDDTPNNDSYLALMPIKTRYKLLYPLVVQLCHSLLFAFLYTLILSILSFVTTQAIDMFSIVLWGILLFIIDIFDLLLAKLLYPMTTQRWIGNFLQNIIAMLVVLGSQALVFFITTQSASITLGLIGSIFLIMILSIVVLYLSIKTYQHTEKGKKEELNF